MARMDRCIGGFTPAKRTSAPISGSVGRLLRRAGIFWDILGSSGFISVHSGAEVAVFVASPHSWRGCFIGSRRAGLAGLERVAGSCRFSRNY